MGILLDNGQIWSNIHIYGQRLAVLNAQITHCRKAPLFVLIHVLPLSAAKYSRYSDLQENIQGAASLIWQRQDQVKHL